MDSNPALARTPFAKVMFYHSRAQGTFTDALAEVGFGEWANIRGDDYDVSVEFTGVAPDARLSDAAQRVVFDAGFMMAFLSHTDGMESRYVWTPGRFSSVIPWRQPTGMLDDLA